MNRRLLGGLTVIPVALAAMGAVGAASAVATGAQADTSTGSGIYIVQMTDLPAVAYDGSIPGYAATQVAKGKKIDKKAPAVARYTARLKQTHDAALQQATSVVSSSSKLYDYTFTYNGFAAELTSAEATRLAKVSGVLNVQK